jgi:hypothetical protein
MKRMNDNEIGHTEVHFRVNCTLIKLRNATF